MISLPSDREKGDANSNDTWNKNFKKLRQLKSSLCQIENHLHSEKQKLGDTKHFNLNKQRIQCKE